jgi:hypothetical protein
MLQLCVGLSPILFHIFCTAHRCLAASKYTSCSFLLMWLSPVLLLKSPLFRQTNPRLSAICSTLLCLNIVGWNHKDGGHARLFAAIVSWLCCYILRPWRVHLHLRRLGPVVCTYHLRLLLQHEEMTWPVCFKKYVWRSFTCLSRSRVTSIKPLPPICRGGVSLSFAAREWRSLYLVSNVLILVWRFSKSVGVHFTIPKLKVSTGVA